MAAAGQNHPLTLLRIHRHRLLAEYMFAVFRSLNCMQTMQEYRSGKVNRINLGISKQLQGIEVTLGNAMAMLEVPQLFRLFANTS